MNRMRNRKTWVWTALACLLLVGFPGPLTSPPLSAGTIPGQSDLAVDKGILALVKATGQVLNYGFSVTNYGPGIARNVLFTELLPTGVSVTPPSGCSFATGQLVCSLGDLNPLQTVVFSLPLQSFIPGPLANTVTVSSDSLDPNPANNVDQIWVGLQPPVISGSNAADLQISSVTLPNDAHLKENMRHDLTITNNGPDPATNVCLIDSMVAPPGSGVILSSIDTTRGSCAISDPRLPNTTLMPPAAVGRRLHVHCDLGDLSAGDSVGMSFNFQIDPGAEGFANSAGVFSSSGDPVLANNETLTLVPGQCLLEDVNSDGLVNLADLWLVQNCSGESGSDPPCDRADVNGDGVVDGADVGPVGSKMNSPNPNLVAAPHTPGTNAAMSQFGQIFALIVSFTDSKQDFIDRFGELTNLPTVVPATGQTGVIGGKYKIFSQGVPTGHVVGTSGAEGCIGVILITPDKQVYVFHFDSKNNPFATLQALGPFPDGTRAALFGGNNEFFSNTTLQFVATYFIQNPHIRVEGFADRIGLWVDDQCNFVRTPGDTPSKNK